MSRRGWRVIFVGVVVALVLSVGIAVVWTVNDRTDYPAVLIGVADDGNATMSTCEGLVVGKLAGVEWRTDEQFVAALRPLVKAAQRDAVQWSSRAGGITVWYDAAGGAKCLNEELQQVASGLQVSPAP